MPIAITACEAGANGPRWKETTHKASSNLLFSSKWGGLCKCWEHAFLTCSRILSWLSNHLENGSCVCMASGEIHCTPYGTWVSQHSWLIVCESLASLPTIAVLCHSTDLPCSQSLNFMGSNCWCGCCTDIANNTVCAYVRGRQTIEMLRHMCESCCNPTILKLSSAATPEAEN